MPSSMLLSFLHSVVLQAGADAKPAMAGAVKAEPTPSPTDSPRPPDLVSLQEMKDFIRSRGGSIPATQLTQQFKSRIVVSPETCTQLTTIKAYGFASQCSATARHIVFAVTVFALQTCVFLLCVLK